MSHYNKAKECCQHKSEGVLWQVSCHYSDAIRMLRHLKSLETVGWAYQLGKQKQRWHTYPLLISLKIILQNQINFAQGCAAICPHRIPWLSMAIFWFSHYNDIIMSMMVSQIISLTIVYSTVYSGADQTKHQSSVSQAFVRGFHRWPLDSTHKGPAMQKMFPFDDIITPDQRHYNVLLLPQLLFGEHDKKTIIPSCEPTNRKHNQLGKKYHACRCRSLCFLVFTSFLLHIMCTK